MIELTKKQNIWRELTSEEWECIAPLIPIPQQQGRPRKVTDRQVVEALRYRAYTNTPWSKLPGLEDVHLLIFKRYAGWRDSGALTQILEKLDEMGLLPDKDIAEVPETEPSEEMEVVAREPEWWELTDEQWEQISALLPPEKSHQNKRYKSNRQMLNAILYREYTNTSWREMPQEFGHWRTLYNHHAKWSETGCLERVFCEMKHLGILSADKYHQGQQSQPGHDPSQNWWELTDEQWNQVSGFLPPEQPQQNSKYKTNRQILNAILYREYTNTPWREMSKDDLSWRTIYERYSDWNRNGSLHRIFSTLKDLGAISDEKYLLGQKNKSEEHTHEWWEMTDEQWQRLTPIFPPEDPNKYGRKTTNNRQMLNAIFCRYYNGTSWQELPEKYGPWRTVIKYYLKWRDNGTLNLVLSNLK